MASMVSILMASGFDEIYHRDFVLYAILGIGTGMSHGYDVIVLLSLLSSPDVSVSCLLTKMTPFVRGQRQITWSYLAAGMTVLANHSRINIAQLLVSVPLVLSRV